MFSPRRSILPIVRALLAPIVCRHRLVGRPCLHLQVVGLAVRTLWTLLLGRAGVRPHVRVLDDLRLENLAQRHKAVRRRALVRARLAKMAHQVHGTAVHVRAAASLRREGQRIRQMQQRTTALAKVVLKTYRHRCALGKDKLWRKR